MADSVLVHTTEISTPIGEMVAAATDTHLVLLEFIHRRTLETQLGCVERVMTCTFERSNSPVFDWLEGELDEYFASKRTEFTVPLYTPGTTFQLRVWDALRGIPSGVTTSYARLAASMGQPTATRAVARANGDNPISIIIPCHRVIGSDGQLVGYGGGLWRKRRLLDLEGRALTLSLFENTQLAET